MRLTSIIWALVVVCAAALLYSVKYEVQAMDGEIGRLQAQIRHEKESIKVLQAEWSFLSRPERVRVLADKHLDMVPVGGDKLVDMADLPMQGEEADVQLANGQNAPQLKPGVIPAGATGYAR